MEAGASPERSDHLANGRDGVVDDGGFVVDETEPMIGRNEKPSEGGEDENFQDAAIA